LFVCLCGETLTTWYHLIQLVLQGMGKMRTKLADQVRTLLVVVGWHVNQSINQSIIDMPSRTPLCRTP